MNCKNKIRQKGEEKMRKNLKIFVSIQIIGLICLSSQAMVLAKGIGSSAGVTLLQPVSAKVSGLGEACASLSGEVFNLHYNPAGLAELKKQAVSLMYQKGLAEDNFTTLTYGKKFTLGTLGVSVLYYDTGEIEMYNTDGVLITEVGQKDMVFSIGGSEENRKGSGGNKS